MISIIIVITLPAAEENLELKRKGQRLHLKLADIEQKVTCHF